MRRAAGVAGAAVILVVLALAVPGGREQAAALAADPVLRVPEGVPPAPRAADPGRLDP